MDQSGGYPGDNRVGKSTRTTPRNLCRRMQRARSQHKKFRRWHRSVDQCHTAVRRLCIVLGLKSLPVPRTPPLTQAAAQTAPWGPSRRAAISAGARAQAAALSKRRAEVWRWDKFDPTPRRTSRGVVLAQKVGPPRTHLGPQKGWLKVLLTGLTVHSAH
jgi:hypothetical protein